MKTHKDSHPTPHTQRSIPEKQQSFLRRQTIHRKDIAVFTRQLVTLSTSGISLLRALDILQDEQPHAEMARILKSIRQTVSEGKMFHQALRQHPEAFPPLFCNLIEAGELSGTLEQMMEKAASQSEKHEQTRQKTQKILLYPAIVLLTGIAVSLVLLIQVIPQFSHLYASFDAELPAITLFFIQLSEQTIRFSPYILSSLVLLPLIIQQSYQKSLNTRTLLDSAVLKLPVIGNLLHKMALASFTRTLSISLAAGATLTQAMKYAATTTGNRALEVKLLQSCLYIESGQPLHFALKSTKICPHLLIQMVRVGEESGALDHMLTRLADFYEQETSVALEKLTTLLEPLIILILGLSVGGLVLAMYMPVFSMNHLF